MQKSILLSILLSSSIVVASGGHFHPKKVAQCGAALCTEDQIKAAVPAGVQELANWKKIDLKWQFAKIESVTKKEFSKDSKTLKTWVVTLINEKETDSTMAKTYLFFLEDGSIFRTNMTGELK